MKTSSKIMLFLGLILILSGIILILISNNEQTKSMEEVIEIITNDYDNKFYKAISEAQEQERDVYTNVIVEEYTIKTITKYEENIKTLKEYETIINKVISSSTNLKEYCLDKRYSDEKTSSKCAAFITNYEQTINKFVDDISLFNSKVNKYNRENEEDYNIYNIQITPVDINKDGIYAKP